MLSCTEEENCVGAGTFMFWQVLSSISLYIYTANVLRHEQVCLMFNEDILLRFTSAIIGPD